MNIRIEWQADSPQHSGFRGWIRPLFVHRLGWIVLAFLLTLAITDGCYLNTLHRGENTTYLLGPAGGVGLFFTYFSLQLLNVRLRRRRKVPPPVLAPRVFYLALTDDAVEKGIIGRRFVRYDWSLLTAFEENDARFVIKMSVHDFSFEKADVKDARQIGEIRALLQSKLPRPGR